MYRLAYALDLGPSKAGLEIDEFAMMDINGDTVGDAPIYTVVELTPGSYMAVIDLPDGFAGVVCVYAEGNFLTLFAVNPQEAEFVDARVSSIPNSIDTASIGEASADVLLNWTASPYDIPGTVGALLGLLAGINTRTSGPITVTVANPVAQNGDVLTIQGDGYKAMRGRALQWQVHMAGLDLTGATVTATIEGETSLACVVQNPAADTKLIVCEPNAEQTATISAGRHKYSLAARWPGDPDPVTLVAGWWTSDERPSVL